MPHGQWSQKRERQYKHIKDSLTERGKSEDLAEEIAAWTVNKEWVQHGEARTGSKATLEDMAAPRRGGRRSHQGDDGQTLRQLYKEARAKGVRGHSTMLEAELEAVLRR